MRKFIIYLVIILSVTCIFAQDNLSSPIETYSHDTYNVPRYGLFVHYNLNWYNANFIAHQVDIQSCCPQFTSGDGSGISLGLLFEHPIAKNFMLGVRAGYYSDNGTFITNQNQVFYDYQNDSWTNGIIEHKLDATIGIIAIEPMINYRFWDNFAGHLGFQFGFVNLSKSFEHTETLKDPPVGTFENGKRTRLESSGDFKNLSSIHFSGLAGLSYEFNLNKDKTLILAPEIFYLLGLTDMYKDVDWKVNNLRFGLALKYAPYEKEKTALTSTVQAKALNPNGSESPIIQIKVEEFQSTRIRPLLTYVFFNENSADIPEKYKKLTPAETQDFTIDKLHGDGVLETYYNVLNIIGKRMLENPDAKISIEGCNSNKGPEKNNNDLSNNRANNVRDYLQNVWGISPDRMIVSSRNLPQEPSNINDPDGIAENQRVEITSNKLEVIAPIITNDTFRIVTPPTVRFKNDYVSDAGLVDWNLVASQDGKPLKTFEGKNELPKTIDWKFDLDQKTIPKETDPLDYQLSVTDKNGRAFETPVQSMPIEQITVEKKRREKTADKYIDRYSLILFQFDESKLSYYNQQIMDFIKKKSSPKSQVFITGHTDRLGNEDYNKKLSTDRAKVVSENFDPGKVTYEGIGENEKKYNNDLPEGRFYCRRVDIRVETPIEE